MAGSQQRQIAAYNERRGRSPRLIDGGAALPVTAPRAGTRYLSTQRNVALLRNSFLVYVPNSGMINF